ncbi:GNAT family N-acetyltransferase [Nocardia sp. NBC_01329]|uniref:GNAT family N-acetyltransferase n=1 Tax=Nocardia sp. NBC_01329 TaxID=2903594 RepID=UPI002E16828A|nr:GNAT family N-acetyltransferase [Nocardia sp. NBC_01329]
MYADLRIRFTVDDGELSRLHAEAFGGDPVLIPWTTRLERHSRSWVGAFVGDRLVGFVHAVWDGGRHAFLLDTAVAPDLRRRRIATDMVEALVADLTRQGIEWLHVDYEPHLADFYRDICGFRDTGAGLLRLN